MNPDVSVYIAAVVLKSGVMQNSDRKETMNDVAERLADAVASSEVSATVSEKQKLDTGEEA